MILWASTQPAKSNPNPSEKVRKKVRLGVLLKTNKALIDNNIEAFMFILTET